MRLQQYSRMSRLLILAAVMLLRFCRVPSRLIPSMSPAVNLLILLQVLLFPLVQPVGIKLPKTTLGNRTRSFNPVWYKSYDWLKYSVTLNTCFCYPCRLFGSCSDQFCSCPEPAFTTNGFKNWKHATGTNGVLNGHANCQSHKQPMVAWHQYKKATQQGSTVSECLGNARSEMIQKNRHYN